MRAPRSRRHPSPSKAGWPAVEDGRGPADAPARRGPGQRCGGTAARVKKVSTVSVRAGARQRLLAPPLQSGSSSASVCASGALLCRRRRQAQAQGRPHPWGWRKPGTAALAAAPSQGARGRARSKVWAATTGWRTKAPSRRVPRQRAQRMGHQQRTRLVCRQPPLPPLGCRPPCGSPAGCWTRTPRSLGPA